MWQDNLFNNLIVIFVLLSLALIVWSKVSRKTLPEMIQEIRDAFSPREVIEQ